MSALARHHLLGALVVAALGGCVSPPVRQERENHQLIAAVLHAELARLPDTLDAEFVRVTVEADSITPDSAARLFEMNWVSAWHSFRANRVVPTPEELARFQRHFDPRNPPPLPASTVPSAYRVHSREYVADSLQTADVGPAYAGCKYGFRRDPQGWVLVPGEPTDCWIR